MIIYRHIWMGILLMINRAIDSAYNRPKLCPSATWNLSAITFANNNTVGTSVPHVFIDKNNTVYVTARSLGYIQIWLKGANTPTRNISASPSGSTSVYATLTGDVYVDNGANNNRVDKWAATATTSIAVMNVTDACYGPFMGLSYNLYCSMAAQHRVVRRSLSNNSSPIVTVAGNGTAGNTSYGLNNPRFIFIDYQNNLYVADFGNNRIQLFASGQLNGTTIAGSGAPGTFALDGPTQVILDADGYMFITDYYNHRIVRSGPSGFACIVACSGVSGATPTQLTNPHSLSFDSDGNLYVADRTNSRVQKFFLATNACGNVTTSQAIPATTEKSVQNPTSVGSSTMQTAQNSTTYPSVQNTTSFTPLTTFFTHTSTESSMTTAYQYGRSSMEISQSTSSSSNTQKPSSLTTYPTGGNSTHPFVVLACPSPTQVGLSCNLSTTPCDALRPCQNNATCVNTNRTTRSFACLCPPGFSGTECQLDSRPCQTNTCWNGGVCNETSNTTFRCQCTAGWHGANCESKINYCDNVTCLNNGVCQPLLLNFWCRCLGDSYTGAHCEITTAKTELHQKTAKSFAYVVIIALISVALFIIMMDALKYIFGIDPVQKERRRSKPPRKVNRKKTRVAVRFTYVNPSATHRLIQPICTI